MSIAVMSKIFPLNFGTCTRKMLAVRLADHCDDDGCGIWPSVNRLARECNMNERTVQRTLKDFVDEGILVVVKQGGKGRFSPTRYDFNLDRLPGRAPVDDGAEPSSGGDHGAVDAEAKPACEAGPEQAEIKGDTESPLEPVQGGVVSSKGDTGSVLGRRGVTQTVIEPSKNHHSPREGASGAADAVGERGSKMNGKAIEKAFKRFGPTWPTWISDSVPQARAEWGKLTDDERAQAEARAQDYRTAVKETGRSHVCSLAVYLKEKRWTQLPAKTAGAVPDRVTIKPYGPRWWAYRRMLCEAGPDGTWRPTHTAQKQIDAAGGVVPKHWLPDKWKAEWSRVATMDALAMDARPISLPADKEPAVTDTRKIRVGSDEWDAFCGKHREKGWPVPEVRRGVEWLDIGILANAGGGSGEAGMARDGGANSGAET